MGDDATVKDLKDVITDKTALTAFDVKYSYPPKPLQLGNDAQLLSALDVRLDGEQLTISAKDSSAARPAAPLTRDDDVPSSKNDAAESARLGR